MRVLRNCLILVMIPVVLIAVAILLIPYFVNLDSYSDRITDKLSVGVGRHVSVEHVKLSLFPLALRVQKLAIAEDPKFGTGAFADMDELRINLNVSALLDHKLDVSSLEAVNPSLNLIKNDKGQWNTDSLAGGAAAGKNSGAKAAGGAAAAAPTLEVARLHLSNGTLTIDDFSGPKHTTQRFDQLDMTMENLSEGRPFDYNLSVRVAGKKEGEIRSNGSMGPMTPPSREGEPPILPVKCTLKMDAVDLGALAGPDGGVQGVLTTDLNIDSDGLVAKVNGTTKVEKLVAAAKGKPAAIPVSANIETDYTLLTEVFDLKNVVVNMGSASATVSGHYNRKRPADTILSVKANQAGLVEIGKLLPALGVILPGNSSFASGTVTNAGDFHGSFSPLNGKATVDILNAKLSGYNVAEKIASVAKFAGIPSSKDTDIQILKGTINYVNGAGTLSDFQLVMPGISVTGGGTIAADNQLDLKMQATLTGNALGAKMISAIAGSKGVPFTIIGTPENPQFVPNVGGLAKERLGGLGGLGGLLGKKPSK